MAEQEKLMSLDEKLSIIDYEIRTLHQFCINKGYNSLRIEKDAQPLLSSLQIAQAKRSASFALKIALVVAVIAVLCQADPIWRFLLLIGRLASIQVLSVWDWTVLHDMPCLISNPYYVGLHLMPEDCELCEHLTEIQRQSNLSQIVMAENYLKREIPVIVTDAMEDWPARELFNIQFIHELYSNEDVLAESVPCMFSSNVRVRYGNVKSILSRGLKGEISNWYAHWENCEKGTGKLLRQFYKRPYVFPPMVELAENNWLMLASQYKPRNFKNLDVALPMIYFGQIRGQSKVRLTPRHPCNETCSTLYATLHEGEILVLGDIMWILDYMPIATTQSISFAAGGYFDS